MGEASQQFTRICNRPAGSGRGMPWVASGNKPPEWDWTELGGVTSSKHRHQLIERAVQRDIVPRLAPAEPEGAHVGVSADCVETFASLVLTQDMPLAAAYIERLHARGMAAQSLYLELLAPAARHFGERWTDDTLDFGQVTIGLGNLHRLLRDLSPVFQAPAAGRQPRPLGKEKRGLLVAASGEQHTFGLAMLAEFFRRARWVIWSGAPSSPAELSGIVRDHWFEMVGFSLAYEGRLDALRAGIRNVRRASSNPCIRIMVGGPVFIEHPEFVAQVGADAMAVDAQQAVIQAENLLARLPACV